MDGASSDAERWCRLMLPYARRIARRIVATDDADDCAAVAIERGLTQLRARSGPREAPGRAWIAACVRHLAVDCYRRGAAELRMLDRLCTQTDRSTDLSGDYADLAVLEALPLLTPAQRETVAAFARSASTDEAAQALGITPNALYLRLERVRRRIAARLPGRSA